MTDNDASICSSSSSRIAPVVIAVGVVVVVMIVDGLNVVGAEDNVDAVDVTTKTKSFVKEVVVEV